MRWCILFLHCATSADLYLAPFFVTLVSENNKDKYNCGYIKFLSVLWDFINLLIYSLSYKPFSPCFFSPFWPRRRSLSEDLLWTGPTVCADGRNRPCWVRLPGKMSALLCASVWLWRQVLWEPLRGLPHRLPGEETDLCGTQQGLLLQRYRMTVTVYRLMFLKTLKASIIFEEQWPLYVFGKHISFQSWPSEKRTFVSVMFVYSSYVAWLKLKCCIQHL